VLKLDLRAYLNSLANALMVGSVLPITGINRVLILSDRWRAKFLSVSLLNEWNE